MQHIQAQLIIELFFFLGGLLEDRDHFKKCSKLFQCVIIKRNKRYDVCLYSLILLTLLIETILGRKLFFSKSCFKSSAHFANETDTMQPEDWLQSLKQFFIKY